MIVSIAIVTEHAKSAGGGGYEFENVEVALDALAVGVDAVTAPGVGVASELVVEAVYEAAVALSLSASEAQTVYSLLNPYQCGALDERSVHDVSEEDHR